MTYTRTTIKVQKVDFQNRAGEALLEKGGSASVRSWYMRYRIRYVRIFIVIKARFLTYLIKMKVKKRAFRTEKMESIFGRRKRKCTYLVHAYRTSKIGFIFDVGYAT